MVTGDLGVTSGYVAANGKELEALKRLGERNYFQFTLLRKDKQPKRVGDVSLKLKSADKKHNRYTIEVLADDKTVEKKDKTINEPGSRPGGVRGPGRARGPERAGRAAGRGGGRAARERGPAAGRRARRRLPRPRLAACSATPPWPGYGPAGRRRPARRRSGWLSVD